MIVALVEGVGQDELKVLVDIGNFEPLMSVQMALMQGKEVPNVDVTPLYDKIARIAPSRTPGACQDPRVCMTPGVRCVWMSCARCG